jgi:hypothetical protein
MRPVPIDEQLAQALQEMWPTLSAERQATIAGAYIGIAARPTPAQLHLVAHDGAEEEGALLLGIWIRKQNQILVFEDNVAIAGTPPRDTLTHEIAHLLGHDHSAACMADGTCFLISDDCPECSGYTPDGVPMEEAAWAPVPGPWGAAGLVHPRSAGVNPSQDCSRDPGACGIPPGMPASANVAAGAAPQAPSPGSWAKSRGWGKNCPLCKLNAALSQARGLGDGLARSCSLYGTIPQGLGGTIDEWRTHLVQAQKLLPQLQKAMPARAGEVRTIGDLLDQAIADLATWQNPGTIQVAAADTDRAWWACYQAIAYVAAARAH